MDALECYECNSKEKPGCATALQFDIFQWNKIQCSGSTNCAVWISNCLWINHILSVMPDCLLEKNDVTTYRGCLPAENDDIDLKKGCDKDLCNTVVFPEKRIKCHQCEGFGCAILNSTITPTTCINYKANDECYIVVTSKKIYLIVIYNLRAWYRIKKLHFKKIILDRTTVYRGCLSDESKGKEICDSDEFKEFCKQGIENHEVNSLRIQK